MLKTKKIKNVSSLVYFRLKRSPTSGRCPQWPIFFKNLFYQNECKEAINIRGGQIRGALFNFFWWKSALICIFRTLPSVSKIIPAHYHFFYCTIFNVTFSDHLQNLWAKDCFSKTVNGNISRVYYVSPNKE